MRKLSLLSTTLVLSFASISCGFSLEPKKTEPVLGAIVRDTSDVQLQCRQIYSIEQFYHSGHIVFDKQDAVLQGRVIDQYIKRLDGMKLYLTAPDVAAIKKIMADSFEKTKKRDCQFLLDVQNIVDAKVRERADFAKAFLAVKPAAQPTYSYKFDPTVEFVFDPDKKAFPKDKQEAEEFLKKYIHFQVANFLVTGQKEEEARLAVIKNWERMLKKLSERSIDDIHSDYLDSYARSLDPHSSYFSKDTWDDFSIQMSLSLEGIGATLSQAEQNGFTIVEALVPGGAAARSGLIQPQDKIVAVGQGAASKEMVNVVDVDLKDVVKKIRGPKGTKVTLTILRKSAEKTDRFDVTLTRDKINLEDEAASLSFIDRKVNGKNVKIGVLNLPSFYSDGRSGGRSAASDVRKLLLEVNKAKVDALIFDVSSNSGGSLDDAVKIAGFFFKTGNVVKQSSREGGRGEAVLKDIDPTVNYSGPLVVLTSRLSASASEIVAGVLQDYKRGLIIGNDHTFGKGSVQQVQPISRELGALKVTVGMFFTAGGNSTQHRGVDADVHFPGAFVTDEMGEKALDYSLPPKTLPAFLSPEAYVTSGEGAWLQLDPKSITALSEKSKVRVAANPEFKKISDELNKLIAKGKVIKLSDIVNDKEAKEKKDKAKAQKNLSKKEKEKEYLKRPELQEAANVAIDLIDALKTQSK